MSARVTCRRIELPVELYVDRAARGWVSATEYLIDEWRDVAKRDARRRAAEAWRALLNNEPTPIGNPVLEAV